MHGELSVVRTKQAIARSPYVRRNDLSMVTRMVVDKLGERGMRGFWMRPDETDQEKHVLRRSLSKKCTTSIVDRAHSSRSQEYVSLLLDE
jgi:predicted RNA-binding protein YlxR (DUF448 family)